MHGATGSNDKDSNNAAVDRITNRLENDNGTTNGARNRAASVIVIDEISPATQIGPATGTAGGGSACNLPTGHSVTANRTANGPSNRPATGATHNRALDRAHTRISKEPSDNPTTGTTTNPAPKDPKKRTFTAMKNVPNARAPPRGNATSTRAPVEIKTEKVRKISTGEMKTAPGQKASESKGGYNQKIIESRGGPSQKVADPEVADPEYVAPNEDDSDDDDSMSEDD